MAEQLANKGYAALKKETTKGTAVTPTVYVPYYNQSISTDIHLISDEPIYGNKFKRLQSLQGIRSHGGSIRVMAEPNTAGYIHDMITTKGTTTGANPYTHPFAASITTDPNSYTLDVSYGSAYVERYIGVEASKITYAWENERMMLDIDVSALSSYTAREIASVSTNALTLTTTYDPTPTAGLVASDLVSIIKANGTIINTTIASVSATVANVAAAGAAAAGDMLVLRPATPSYTILTPFLWGKTEFRFGATAAAALSATQTRLESGTEISLMHEFVNSEGEKRSGAFDPAALLRGTYDLECKVKVFLDNPEKQQEWLAIAKQSLVMRAFAGATNQHELRVTLNDLRIAGNDHGMESSAIAYHEFDMVPNYDTSDAAGFGVTVINAVATI